MQTTTVIGVDSTHTERKRKSLHNYLPVALSSCVTVTVKMPAARNLQGAKAAAQIAQEAVKATALVDHCDTYQLLNIISFL